MRICSLVLIALLGGSCASSIRIYPIDYDVLDRPSVHRVEVIYTNDSGETVCLPASEWPNQAGLIDNARGEVYLLVGDRRFSIQQFNTGYTLGCALLVRPGETVRGWIAYESFDLPESLYEDEKRLEFEPLAEGCGVGGDCVPEGSR